VVERRLYLDLAQETLGQIRISFEIGKRTFMASIRSERTLRTLYTWPMPPAPRIATIS